MYLTGRLRTGRIVVLAVAPAAFLIASSLSCKGLMNLVSCAGAAFGSAFGPVMILALFWKRLTYNGALAGFIAGFVSEEIPALFEKSRQRQE